MPRPEPDLIVSKPAWVGIVGATRLAPVGIDAYLSRTNQDWQRQPGRADPDTLVEFAGRVCYQSFDRPRPGGQDAYLANIKEHGHGSILEHASVSFIVTGVSRNLTHELVRHRAGFGFSQLSQRYVSAEHQRFVPPREFWDDPTLLAEWWTACERAILSYRTIVARMNDSPQWASLIQTDRRKHVRQAARSVLPGSAETHIVVTGNLRAWRHFVAQRGSPAADTEIRGLACLIAGELEDYAPVVMRDLRWIACDDGTTGVSLAYPKI